MTHNASHQETDPTLAIAERQLVLLGELAEIVMVAARAFGVSAVAAAEAETMILGEEHFTPEVGRARACGAKDTAESLQKVARAARLTMKLQMAVAEMVRDIRAGVVRRVEDARETLADLGGVLVRRRLAGSRPDAPDRDRERGDIDTERLVEFDRAEALSLALFREVVDEICADVGAVVDWAEWRIETASRDSDAAPDPEGREGLPRQRPETAHPP